MINLMKNFQIYTPPPLIKPIKPPKTCPHKPVKPTSWALCQPGQVIHNTKNTNDRRYTAISTPEIYNNILYSLKETNSFEGHLIKDHMANYICIDTN